MAILQQEAVSYVTVCDGGDLILVITRWRHTSAHELNLKMQKKSFEKKIAELKNWAFLLSFLPCYCRFLVDDVKAAIEVQQSSDRRVTKAEVTRAVKSLMTEDAGRVVRENVEKLRDLALKAVAKGGSVQKNCETFIKELQTVHSFHRQAAKTTLST
jgi:hypothetical protein